MSHQFVLDDHLGISEVLLPIERWATVCYLRDLRPGETIKDDRIPTILLTKTSPTFVTIDQGFGHSRWRHPGYAIICFDLPTERQVEIPGLLRQLINHDASRTRRARMGSVVRVSPERHVTVWRFGLQEVLHFRLAIRARE